MTVFSTGWHLPQIPGPGHVIAQVKQHWDWLVLGWVTLWEPQVSAKGSQTNFNEETLNFIRNLV